MSFAIIGFISSHVFADQLIEKTDVPVNKSWTITFNTPMEKNTVNQDTVYVLKDNNEKVTINLEWLDKKTLAVTPETPYLPNTAYDLYITDKAIAINKKPLKEQLHLAFQTTSEKEPLEIRDNIKLNDPKVVMIETDFGSGSGVVVGDGLILTNSHVVNGMTKATVLFNDGTKIPVEGIVKADIDKDFALIKTTKTFDVEPVTFGDSSLLEKGEEILTIGSPRGLQNTTSQGLVSGKREYNNEEVIQITAPVQHGSSGGGLFNKNGELVGITSFIIEGSGNLNFAISTNEIKDWQPLFKKPYNEITVKPTTKTPTGLTAKALSNGVRIDWDSQLADYFIIYYSDNPNGPFYRLENADGLVQTTESSFDDYDISPGDTWFYTIAAVKDDLESPMSDVLKVSMSNETLTGMQNVQLFMTKDEVKQNAPGTIQSERFDELVYTGQQGDGYTYTATYHFQDNALQALDYEVNYLNDFTKEDLTFEKQIIVYALNNSFGTKPNTDDEDWSDNQIGASWNYNINGYTGDLNLKITMDDKDQSKLTLTISGNPATAAKIENTDVENLYTVEPDLNYVQLGYMYSFNDKEYTNQKKVDLANQGINKVYFIPSDEALDVNAIDLAAQEKFAYDFVDFQADYKALEFTPSDDEIYLNIVFTDFSGNIVASTQKKITVFTPDVTISNDLQTFTSDDGFDLSQNDIASSWGHKIFTYTLPAIIANTQNYYYSTHMSTSPISLENAIKDHRVTIFQGDGTESSPVNFIAADPGDKVYGLLVVMDENFKVIGTFQKELIVEDK